MTYLRRKIHFQSPVSLITPPRIGPRMLAMANTELTAAEYGPNHRAGQMSITETKTTENMPEPPIP